MAETAKVSLKVVPPRWANFVFLDFGDGKNSEKRMVSVGTLTDKAIEMLCESFRAHCKNKASEPADD